MFLSLWWRRGGGGQLFVAGGSVIAGPVINWTHSGTGSANITVRMCGAGLPTLPRGRDPMCLRIRIGRYYSTLSLVVDDRFLRESHEVNKLLHSIRMK